VATGFDLLRSKWGVPTGPGGLLATGKTPEQIAEEEEQARLLEEQMAAEAAAAEEQKRQAALAASDELAPLPDEAVAAKPPEKEAPFAISGEDGEIETGFAISGPDETFQLDTEFKFEKPKPGETSIQYEDTGPIVPDQPLPKEIEEASIRGDTIQTEAGGYRIIPKEATGPVTDPSQPLTVKFEGEEPKSDKVATLEDHLKYLTREHERFNTPATANLLAQGEKARRLYQFLDEHKVTSDQRITVEKAAFYDMALEAINGPLWDASPKEIQDYVARLNNDFFDGKFKGEWGVDAVAEYRKQGGQLPSELSFEGDETVSDKTIGKDKLAWDLIAKGAATSRGGLYRAGQAIEEITGLKFDADVEGKSKYYEAIAGNLPEGTTLEQVNSFGSALKYVSDISQTQLGNVAMSLTGGVAGGLVRGSLGAYIGAFGTSFPMELGEVQKQMKELDPEQKAGLSNVLFAGAAATLDAATGGQVGGALTKEFGKEIADQIALRMLLSPAKEYVKTVGKGAGKAALTEAPTEGLQGMLEEVGAAVRTGKPLKPGLLKRMGEQAVAGAVMGGQMGAVGGVSEAQAGFKARENALRPWATTDTEQATLGMNVGRRMGAIPGRPVDLKATKVDARPVTLNPDERREQVRPRLVRPTPNPVSRTGKTEKHIFPKGTITSKPGPRRSFRTLNGQRASSNHGGYDIGGMKKGAPIGATASGNVVSAGPARGYGNRVVVEHSDGSRSTYAHLNDIKVKVGQQVNQGQKLGGAGQTGNATGVHLHYELRDRNGAPLDPRNRQVAMLEQAPDTGEWIDPSGNEVSQTPVDYGEDTLEELQAMDEAFTEATGQQWDEDDFAPAEEEIEEPTIARGMEEEAPEERPSVRRGAVSQALDEDGATEPAIVRGNAEASLQAAQEANPARAKLEELTAAPPAGPTEAAPQADYTQPLPGEVPMMGQDEYGAPTQEVVGFHNQETDEVRMVGDPPGAMATAEGAAVGGPLEPVAEGVAVEPLPEAQPPLPPAAAPVAEAPPAGPMFPVTDVAVEWTQPAEHEGLAIDERAKLLKSMPKSPRGASFDAKAGRSVGQSVALGMSEAPSLKGQSAKFKTAYKIGLAEGKASMAKAKAGNLVAATSGAEVSATTPVAAKGSKPKAAPAPKGKKIPALKAKMAAKAEPAPTTMSMTLGTTPGDVHHAKDLPPMTEGLKAGVARLDTRPEDQENILDAIGRGLIRDGDMIVMGNPRWAIENGYADIGPVDGSRRGRLTEKGKAKLAELQKEQAQPETKQTKPAPTPTKSKQEPERAEPRAEPREISAEPFDPPEQLAGLSIEDREGVADTLPTPKGGSEETRQARRDGQLQRLGLERPVGTKGKSQAYTTAFNVGVKDAEAGIAKTKAVATPTPTKTPAPAAKPTKLTAEVKKQIAEIERQADRIYEKFFDLQQDGTKSRLRGYLNGLVKKGVLEQADVDGLDYLFKDKDMGVEDVVSDIEGTIDTWKEEAIAALEGTGLRPLTGKKRPTEETPSEQADRAERGRPEADDQRGQEGSKVAGEWVRPRINSDGTVTVQHFGPEGLTETDPKMWGKSKSLSREERAYIEKAPPRTHFGLHTGEPGGYIGEFGPDTPRYEARIPFDRLYDVIADPDGLWVRGRPERGENNIKDAGYAGYWYKNNELGLVAEVFEPVKVTRSEAAKPKMRVTAPKPKARFGRKKAPQTIEEYIAPPVADPKDVREYGDILEHEIEGVWDAMLEVGIHNEHDIRFELVSQAMAKAYNSDVKAHNESLPPGERGEDYIDYAGVYDATDRSDLIIRIVAWPWESTKQTGRHEIMHWLVDPANKIISDKEWDALTKWALANPSLMKWAEANYPLDVKGNTRATQIEEAIAEGYARWELGDPLMRVKSNDPTTLVQKFFEFLHDLRQRILLAFDKADISKATLQEATDLMTSIRTGNHLRKFDAANVRTEAGRTTFERAVSKAVMLDDITVDQAGLLRSVGEDGLKARQVWHGTPAQMIERFSLAYLGTGEGQQAKGWGLYFADKKGVADWYRAKNTIDQTRPATLSITVNGQPIIAYVGGRFGDVSPNSEWDKATFEVATLIHDYLTKGGQKYNGWLETLHVAYDKEMHGALADAQNEEHRKAIEAGQRKVGQIFGGLRMKDVAFDRGPTAGALYKAEIPDTHFMLDMDRKLDNQSDHVTAALSKLRGHLESKGLLEGYERKYGDFWSWTGETLQLKIMGREMIVDEGYPDAPADSELGVAIQEDEGPKAASLYLKSLGIPGNQYLDRDSRDPAQTEKTRNYVIFDDSLIEITGKEIRPEWGGLPKLGGGKRRVIANPTPTVLGDPSVPNPSALRKGHDLALDMLNRLGTWDWNAESDANDTLWDAFRRKVHQKYLQVEKGQARAEAFLGVDRLPPEMNVMERITADERGYKVDHLTDNLFKPLAEELARSKLAVADLGLYLYARHAPARNRAVAKINPEFRDPAKPGSGMTDAEAGQIMQQFIADGQMDDLQAAAVWIDRMIAMAQEERINGKLITQKTVDAGFGPQDHYVPLRGHEKVEPWMEMKLPVEAKGFSVKGSEGHRMFGRESRADLESIIGYTVAQAQQAIDRSYRNSVAGALYNMLRAVPDPSFVKLDRVERVATWNPKKKQVEYQMQTRIKNDEEDARTVYYKDGDTVHKMTFQKSNLSAMRFVRAIKNLDVQALHPALRAASTFTKMWTQANTSWNIDFILRNAVKDVQTGVLNASTLGEKGIRREIIKNLPGALYGATRGVFSKTGAGEGAGSKWFKAYAEFEKAGGKLNYNQTEQLEDIIKRTKREMKLARQGLVNPVKAGTAILEFISNLSSSLENMTRLAAFVALREKGIPAKQAAEAVRELTTNFQQHGEWGPKINALYGFANASAVGGGRFMWTLRKSPMIMVGLATAGVLSDVLNHLLDEDGWDEYTEEEKDQAFKLMLPEWAGFDLSIPIGYGVNSFVTVGRKMSELWREKTDKDGNKLSKTEAMADVFYSFVNAFSPIGGRSVWNLVAPSIGDPIADILQNRNNWDHKLYPDEWPGQEDDPQSQEAFDSTSDFWKTVATGMNAWTGGNDVLKGWIDVHPATLEHAVSQTFGGLGRSIGRVVTLPGKLASGEWGPGDLPVLRGFATLPHGADDPDRAKISTFNERYYPTKQTVDKAKDVAERYGTDSPQYKKYYEEHKAAIKMATPIKVTATAVRKISLAKGALQDGLVNAKGLTQKQANAIRSVTGDEYKEGQKLTQAQVDASQKKIEQVRLKLAEKFDEIWQKKMMGTEAKAPAPTSP
jgi:murein DD-endopeptidase MepM/ murein hydrolase activator NlpD